jgi:hypothetical protein
VRRPEAAHRVWWAIRRTSLNEWYKASRRSLRARQKSDETVHERRNRAKLTPIAASQSGRGMIIPRAGTALAPPDQ